MDKPGSLIERALSLKNGIQEMESSTAAKLLPVAVRGLIRDQAALLLDLAMAVEKLGVNRVG